MNETCSTSYIRIPLLRKPTSNPHALSFDNEHAPLNDQEGLPSTNAPFQTISWEKARAVAKDICIAGCSQ